jgi:hypothetical protein
MDKPITWRGYLRLTAICTVIGSAISGAYMVMLMEPAWWKATKDFIRRLFRK